MSSLWIRPKYNITKRLNAQYLGTAVTNQNNEKCKQDSGKIATIQ
jgi:hypothetical protein